MNAVVEENKLSGDQILTGLQYLKNKVIALGVLVETNNVEQRMFLDCANDFKSYEEQISKYKRLGDTNKLEDLNELYNRASEEFRVLVDYMGGANFIMSLIDEIK